MGDLLALYQAPVLESQGFGGMPLLRPYRTKATNTLYTLMDHMWYRDKAGNYWWSPKGMLTDLASIPHIVDGVFINVETRAPGAIHDGIYMLSCVTGVKRETADLLFREMSAYMGANGVQADLLKAGLAVGGWHSWNECQSAGVTWDDFDVTVLDDAEIADYRERFKIPDLKVA